MEKNEEKDSYYIRPVSKADRPKMQRTERAKQFMPFAALKGYPEALRKKEKILVPKAELSEESVRLLDIKMHQVKKRDMVTVVYYKKGEYIQLTGMVSALDLAGHKLKIVNTTIPFEDIYDISGENIQTDGLIS